MLRSQQVGSFQIQMQSASALSMWLVCVCTVYTGYVHFFWIVPCLFFGGITVYNTLQEDAQKLTDMFPAVPRRTINNILSDHSLKDSIEYLLSSSNQHTSYETLGNSAESVTEERLKVVPSIDAN